MSQFDFGTIDPDVRDGTWLAESLNSWRDALHTMHAGAAEPSYKVDGMFWRDTAGGNNNTIIKVRHNATWLPVITLDAGAGTVTFANMLKKNGDTFTGTLTANAPLVLDGANGGLIRGESGSDFSYDATNNVWNWTIGSAVKLQLFSTGLVIPGIVHAQAAIVEGSFANTVWKATGASDTAYQVIQAGSGKAVLIEKSYVSTVNWFRWQRRARDTFTFEANILNLNVDTGDLEAAGDVTAFSDERVKDDIRTLFNALEKVRSLRGVSYTRKETSRRGVGMIAQEVQKVVPDVVREGPDGLLSIAYGNMVGLLVEAVKELADRVEELERRTT